MTCSACKYLSHYESCYLQVVCAVMVFLLGPWIGFQFMAYLASTAYESASIEASYEFKTLVLCCVLNVASVLALARPKHIGFVGIWIVAFTACVLGHWFVYWQYETFRTMPESKSECLPVYVGATVFYFLAVVPSAARVTRSSCYGGSANSSLSSGHTSTTDVLLEEVLVEWIGDVAASQRKKAAEAEASY